MFDNGASIEILHSSGARSDNNSSQADEEAQAEMSMKQVLKSVFSKDLNSGKFWHRKMWSCIVSKYETALNAQSLAFIKQTAIIMLKINGKVS